MRYTIQMDVLKGLIYQVSREIFFSAKDRLDLFLYGYPVKYSDAQVEYLIKALDTLNRIDKALLNDVSPCLEYEHFEKLAANLNRILSKKVDKYDCRMSIDDSNKVQWELAHPYCVTRTRWEELAYWVCGNLSMTISTSDKACDILFDISSNSLSCDTLAALSVHQKLCDLNYKVKRSEEECKIDYTLLMEKHPSCDFTFKNYKSLLDCNMSYDLIDRILCDASFIWKNGVPYIKTQIGEYKVGSDFQFTEVLTPAQCAAGTCKSSCSVDDGSFYKKLLSDYGLTNEEKQKILSKIYK